MTYEKREYPEWSWSLSRYKVFGECKRKYNFIYYLSHNGWSRDSDKLAQQTYRLKNLTSLSLILGNELHSTAKDLINNIRYNQPCPSSDEIKLAIRNTLNQAYLISKHRRSEWENSPKKIPMLSEIYYGGSLKTERVDDIKNSIDKCVNNLLSSNTISGLSAMQNLVSIKEVDEDLQHVNMNGTKVYVRLDLLYQSDNSWVITDWKTGKDTSPDITDQLALYALYVHQKYGVDINNIEACVESLLDGAFFSKRITSYNITNIQSLILNSIDQMQSYLDDVDLNKPLPIEKFEWTDKLYRCAVCNFREICI